MFATTTDAHSEWHRNSGIPVGLPCPWDACDPAMLDISTLRRLTRIRDINRAFERGEAGTATIRCAHCQEIHFSVANVRRCAAGQELLLAD